MEFNYPAGVWQISEEAAELVCVASASEVVIRRVRGLHRFFSESSKCTNQKENLCNLCNLRMKDVESLLTENYPVSVTRSHEQQQR